MEHDVTDTPKAASPRLRWPVIAVLAVIALLLLAAGLMSLGALTATPAASQQATAAPEVSPAPPWRRPDPAARLSRIAFGSCLDQKKPQPIWQSVIAAKPDLFLMIGDNVYGDVKSPDRRELIEAYAQQARQGELAAVRAKIPLLAVWDDHDYGLNDGGADFEHRDAAAELFRAFWQQPEANGDGSRGVYYSWMLGPAGARVQVIMLDTRSFRSPLTRATAAQTYWGRYLPDPDPAKSMLGEAQWAWLADELKKPAEIRLVVSSIQVLAEGHNFERWGNLPRERDRLSKLVRDSGAKGVIFLSGDRHVGAIYREADAAPYRLIDFTSSSLNRSYGPSRDGRLPPLVSDIFHAENFGVIDIDWQQRRIRLALKGMGGDDLATLDLAFSDLGH